MKTRSVMVANRPGWRMLEQVDRSGSVTRILLEPGARRTAGNHRTPCGQRNAPPVQEMTTQQLRDWSHRLHEQADGSDDVNERLRLLERAALVSDAAELSDRAERRRAAARVATMEIRGILLD